MSHPIQPSFLETMKEIREVKNLSDFQIDILIGIPDELPDIQPLDSAVSHAPERVIEGVLSPKEKKLAIQNALRYFPAKHHAG